MYYLSFMVGRSGHITSFAIDVTTLEPYKSCGQLANKAQGFALGSLVPNYKMWFFLYYYKIKRIVTNVTILFIWTLTYGLTLQIRQIAA